MMKLVKYFLSIFFLLITFQASANASSFYFLREGNSLCSQENVSALENILDADSQEEREQMIVVAIDSGACTGLSVVSTAIANIKGKKTRKGNAYSCFNLYDTEGPVMCSFNQFVTNIESEIQRREGSFQIVGEGPGGTKARCIEGGTVLLIKNSTGWKRLSILFPKELDPITLDVITDQDAALRDGCKGLDYR